MNGRKTGVCSIGGGHAIDVLELAHRREFACTLAFSLDINLLNVKKDTWVTLINHSYLNDLSREGMRSLLKCLEVSRWSSTVRL